MLGLHLRSPLISTHSRAKAAGGLGNPALVAAMISTHSRAKAAGGVGVLPKHAHLDFNSQPREGGWRQTSCHRPRRSHFNSQPREGGWAALWLQCLNVALFQLTAARRRLDDDGKYPKGLEPISTHSRAKAAGLADIPERIRIEFQLTAARRRLVQFPAIWSVIVNFNSQPREGGWFSQYVAIKF